MSNPLFYADDGRLATAAVGADVVLTGPEARHAAQVMRLGTGAAVDVADGSGRRVTGPVTEASADRLVVRAEAVTDEPEPTPALVLVQALAKGDRDLLAIQTATELGIDAVRPWQAERSIVRWKGEKRAKAIAKWEAALLAAAKQARRTRVPGVGEVLDGVGVASACRPGALVLMLHEDADRPLEEALRDAGPQTDTVVLVVGPEGGISPAEASALTEAGAVAVLLGPNVLRSSTAGPAATAVLQQLLGRFGPRS